VTGSSRSHELLEQMLTADREGAQALVASMLEQGIDGQEIVRGALSPALVAMGRRWGKSSISLAQAYIAGKIAEETLVTCLDGSGQGESSLGDLVIGNIEDDFHGLGRRIVSAFATARGWRVHDLGNDVTPQAFVDKALETGAHVIAVSAMMNTTAQGIGGVRRLLDECGLGRRIKLAVGGAVFGWRPELVEEVGADGWAPNAAEAPELFERLQRQAIEEARDEQL